MGCGGSKSKKAGLAVGPVKDGKSPEYDFLFKLLNIGDSDVGKTNLILRFADNKFLDSVTTIGVDFKIKTLQLDGKTIKIQIWDTSGQERFRTITSSYYRGGHAIIDITSQESFNNIRAWLSEIDRYACENVLRLIVGCKADLELQRTVRREEGKEFADRLGLEYFECSAKTGEGVTEIFDWISRQLVKQYSEQ